MNVLSYFKVLVCSFLAAASIVTYIYWSVKKPDISDLVRRMSDYGFDLNCGAHVDEFTGYFAMFYKKNSDDCCSECGCVSGTWRDAGHADNLPDAVTMAAKIAFGLDTDIPSAKEFE